LIATRLLLALFAQLFAGAACRWTADHRGAAAGAAAGRLRDLLPHAEDAELPRSGVRRRRELRVQRNLSAEGARWRARSAWHSASWRSRSASCGRALLPHARHRAARLRPRGSRRLAETSGDDNDPEEKKAWRCSAAWRGIRPLPGSNTILIGHGNGVVALASATSDEGEAADRQADGDGIVFIAGVKPMSG